MSTAQLLLIGPAAPSRAAAAGVSTQLALFFGDQMAVTLVISDYAPPPTGFPNTITIIRERELRSYTKSYRTAKRLYILDDSYESLFALRLLEEAPAPWINADTTLHNLLLGHHKAQAKYPKAYYEYLEQSLGRSGRHVAHSLTGGTRISKSIASEIESFDALTQIAAHVKQSNDHLSLAIAPTSPLGQQREDSCFDIVTIGGGAIAEAVDVIQSFGKEITCQLLTGSEPDLADRIARADVTCLLDKNHRLPSAALTLALSSGKAIVTASQPWVRHLPADTRLNIPHADALHQLVAALASLIGHSRVREWLEKGARNFIKTVSLDQKKAALTEQILSTQMGPLTLAAPKIDSVRAKPTEQKAAEATEIALPPIGTQIPYALIGAVPAQALVTKLFPFIDWNRSPRFATPELSETLCKATGKTAPVMLALLGYESLLIETKASPSETADHFHMPEASDWATVCQKLKDIQNAITFDCVIEGLPKARPLTPDDTQIPGGLPIDFAPDVHAEVTRQPTSGFLEKSGTYWQLNKTEHRIDCLLISGVPGDYSLSIGVGASGKEVGFMVANSQTSQLLKNDSPAVITTDMQGVIQFSLSAVHPVNHYPLTFEQLLKTLACTPLDLKWCSHG
ncbi:MAG: hypothetical protein AB3N28_08135 [Kordiimonas sp.]